MPSTQQGRLPIHMDKAGIPDQGAIREDPEIPARRVAVFGMGRLRIGDIQGNRETGGQGELESTGMASDELAQPAHGPKPGAHGRK